MAHVSWKEFRFHNLRRAPMTSLHSRSLLVLAVIALSCAEDSGAPAEVEATPESKEPSVRARLEELMGGTFWWATRSAGLARSGFGTVNSTAGQCTASVVYTSGFRRRTWVITASHCFDGAFGSVSFLSPTGSMLLIGGTFIQSPSYHPVNTWPAYDIALVFFPTGLPVLNNAGLTLNEFFRPVWSTDPSGSGPVGPRAVRRVRNGHQ